VSEPGLAHDLFNCDLKQIGGDAGCLATSSSSPMLPTSSAASPCWGI